MKNTVKLHTKWIFCDKLDSLVIRNLLMCNITLKLQKISSKFCRIQPSFMFLYLGEIISKMLNFTKHFDRLAQTQLRSVPRTTTLTSTSTPTTSATFNQRQTVTPSLPFKILMWCLIIVITIVMSSMTTTATTILTRTTKLVIPLSIRNVHDGIPFPLKKMR